MTHNCVYFSFIDAKELLGKVKGRNLIKTIVYIACTGLVIWQLWSYVEIITSSPTTASKKLVETKQLPLAFTFCKMFYEKSFDGNFTSQTHTTLKNISIFTNDSKQNLLLEGEFSYDFVSHVEHQLMCKEIDMTNILKEEVQLIREYVEINSREDLKRAEQNDNFHLYIHQPGMFYRNELGLKYPSSQFTHTHSNYDIHNPQAKIKVKAYDLSLDPHIPCTSVLYKECITKEIILKFNASFGCTYPIQR